MKKKEKIIQFIIFILLIIIDKNIYNISVNKMEIKNNKQQKNYITV